MTGVSAGRYTHGRFPSVRDFWVACKWTLVIGLALRLVLAPFTSISSDVVVWAQVIQHGIDGIGIYTRPGFSYPPVWGYLLSAAGVVAGHIGVSGPSLVRGNAIFRVLAQETGLFGATVTTPLVTALLKVPLIASDVVVAWLVWRLSAMLGAGTVARRAAVAAWFLNPLVVYESSVHGAFDTLVALSVLMALVARVERRYVLSGAALAFGVFVKLSPAFLVPLFLVSCLWPLIGEAEGRRLRNIIAMIVGGLGATLALSVPLIVTGEVASSIANVFARGSVQPVIGGVSVFGFTNIPALSTFATTATQPGSQLPLLGEISDVLVALVGASFWIVLRRRSQIRMVAVTSIILIGILLIGPLTNPQYVVWAMAPLAALSVGRPWIRNGLLCVGIGGICFDMGLVGPSGLLGPLSVITGWPSPGLIAREMQWLLTSRAWFGYTPGSVLRVAGWSLTMVGLVVTIGNAVLSHVLRAPRGDAAMQSSGEYGDTAAWRSSRGRRWRLGSQVGQLAAVVGALTLLAEVVVMSPGQAPVQLTARYTPGPGSGGVTWHVAQVPPGRLHVTALTAASSPPGRNVVLYVGSSYPLSGSSSYEVQGLVNHLPVDLRQDGAAIPVSTVGAVGLIHALRPSGATGRVVVLATGTLPRTVWSSTVNLVSPFLWAGGLIVWGGDLPGYYSVGPSPTMTATASPVKTPSFTCGPRPERAKRYPLVKAVSVLGTPGVDRFLGASNVLPSTWGWSCAAAVPSQVASALSLSSDSLHAGPTTAWLARHGGTSLGYVSRGRSSISWIPQGAGGILLFGGRVNGASLASDAALILSLGGIRPDLRVLEDQNVSSGNRGIVRISLSQPLGAGGRIGLVVSNSLGTVLATTSVSRH